MSSEKDATENKPPKAPSRVLDGYPTSHFLRFGGEEDFVYKPLIDTAGARDYLAAQGFSHGNLTHSRHERDIAIKYKGYHSPFERQCDFCGKRLTGVSYEVLRDGRERCDECSQTVVTGQDSLSALFQETKTGMTVKYGIDFPVPIGVRVTTAEKVARGLGESFLPTPSFDARAVGYATYKRGTYCIVLENETPRMSLVATMAHELTHIWQFTHWNLSDIQAKYGRCSLAILEGHAMWSEIQYLYLLNESRRADYLLARSIGRKDEYGFGLRLYLKQYSISQGIVLREPTPFMNLSEPIKLSLLEGLI